MISADFAGEIREFELRPTQFVGATDFETPHGTLGDLAQLAARGMLGAVHVRHVLAHALAGPDNPLAFYRAQKIVGEELEGKPLAPYISLVTEIITEAFAGQERSDA
jgi:hypothetical protein